MTTIDDGDFIFADEEDEISIVSTEKGTWKVAIVDDEEQIHSITKMVLGDFTLNDRKIEFLSAYSGEEARALLKKHPDIAVLLLDVVMEHDHSGLELVEYIRETLKNHNIRIVLRTGQPGQAPEREVISKYDINDYKEKTELTARKLYTLMYSCLRSYRDIIALERNRKGLERVIKASQQIFSEESLEVFAEGVIKQITSLLHMDEDAFFGQIDSIVSHEYKNGIKIVAGTGIFRDCAGEFLEQHLPQDWEDVLNENEHTIGSIAADNYFMAQLHGKHNQRNILMLSGIGPKDDLDLRMLEIFCQNALIAFDNLQLKNEIEETQRELVYRLGEAVETRSKETGNHVKRVAEISRLLALKTGLTEHEAEMLKLASPMHDVGKIGIPDAILNKPGKLDADEWIIMQSHAELGYEMLASSEREILQLGGRISLEHHEKWDGSGYPRGKKGGDISIQGRITAIADVYDALASDRCYKKAWPLDKVQSFFKDQSGIHFDPDLVRLLFDHLDEVNAIRDRYCDIYVEEEGQ
ncbi:DUF3369 domain-containing protein [Terasakiella pusilla]|uniref:DUF3369 domain-containing protein n=1 Tax=Terasakiella pusilla TaxID=64973 RepID=UPI003AA84263